MNPVEGSPEETSFLVHNKPGRSAPKLPISLTVVRGVAERPCNISVADEYRHLVEIPDESDVRYKDDPELAALGRSSILSVEAIDEIKRLKGTEYLLNYFHESKVIAFQCFIFILAVVTTSLHLIIYEIALWDPALQKKSISFLPYSLQTCYYLMSVLLGNVISYGFCGKEGIKNCWNIRAILFVFPSAAILVTVEMLDPFILERIPASARAVVTQVRLPVLALVTTLILRRKLNAVQWTFIIGTTLSVMGFSFASTNSEAEFEKIGMVLCFFQTVVSSIGTLVSEVTFKHLKYPFYTQIAQARLLSFFSSFMALMLYCWYQQCFHLIFFHGWNYRIFLLVIWLTIRDWIQTFTIKLLSALWKSLASAVSLCLTYAIQVALQSRPCTPILVLFTLLVVTDIIGFSLAKTDAPNKPEKLTICGFSFSKSNTPHENEEEKK